MEPYGSGEYGCVEPDTAMMPSLLLRCPNCGRLRLRRQFAAVDDGVVECPRCGCQFETMEDPRLN